MRYDVICAGNENGKPVFLCIGSTVFHARGENTIAAFPSRGRCPEGADRALAVCKTGTLMSPSLLVPSLLVPSLLVPSPQSPVPSQLDTFVTVRMRCLSCSSLVYVICTVRLYPPSASDAVEVTVPSVRDADVSVTVTLTRRPFTESVNL